MAVILGINSEHACSAAALLIDGMVVGAIAEERLNRRQYYARFPGLAIRQLLAMGNLRPSDIDIIAIPRKPNANLLPKMTYALCNFDVLPYLWRSGTSPLQPINLRNELARALDQSIDSLHFRICQIEHHLAHIASAYFCSPWEQAAGFSVDGSGDFVSTMLADCQGPDIHIKQRIHLPHSLGFLYTMICQFIGYTKFGDEGKVMGLAPYGEDRYRDEFADLLRWTGRSFRLNERLFRRLGSEPFHRINDQGCSEIARLWSEEMPKRFGPSRALGSEITQRDKDLAFGVQAAFESTYLQLLRHLNQLVGSERVVIAGGGALNSVANGKIFSSTPFRETWIQPAAGDEGLALGAALYASQSILKEERRYAMADAYLGPEFSPDAIRNALDRAGQAYRPLPIETIIQQISTALAEGKVVGWFQGRMEWGPRALGNRSILAHPGLPGMKDTLNARIKRREWFRPFAPAVLAEYQAEIFTETHPSPYMLHVYGIRPTWRERLSAVNHIDNTGRLQSVSREENPRYYDLIKAFYTLTGIPVLLNTSFNENEPIVCTPEEAIACFQRTRMDWLVLGDFVCKKHE